MKKLYSLIVSLFFILGLQAQVVKTIENTAGHLDSLLSSTELATITNLTITGTLNARDFKTMRDRMPVLAVLDIRMVSITAYIDYNSSRKYVANEIPEMAFYDKVSLKTFYFPLSCISIGGSAFSGCSGLTGELKFPSTIKFIDNGAFSHCTGLTGHLVIPPLVTEIESNVFWGCSGFTSLTIPPSVKAIKFNAFHGCSSLQFIEVQPLTPIPLSIDLQQFDQVDKATCILRVPYGTRELYASAPVWDEFENIVEQEQGFMLSATSLRFEKDGDTNSSIRIKANTPWSVDSDQQWLSVSPLSGNSDQILTITVEANTAIDGRQGTLTFSSEGIDSQLIHVTQFGAPKIVNITPGGLAEAFTSEEKAVLSKLILTGSMDARDFNTIRYQMPMLEALDISGATIEAYTDTTYGNRINHAANTIPFAIHEWTDVFQTSYSLSEHPTLSVVKLPASLTTIEYRAFYACPNLTKVEMQSSVTAIGIEAFLKCSALTTINLSPTITLIDDNAFEKCSSLPSIELPSSLTAINTSVFAECSSLLSIVIPESVTVIRSFAFYRCSKLESVVMPPHLATIHDRSFSECNNLTSITIPKSVTHISSQAFSGCKSLQSIYAYSEKPVDFLPTQSFGVFDHVDKSACIVYVPYGTKELYASTYGWKDFLNIVEMAEFTLSPASLTLEPAQTTVTVELTTATEWSVSSTHPWLKVTPSSGSGNATFALNVEANPTVDQRIAAIIFKTNASTTPNVKVTQKGIPVTADVTAGNLSALFPDAKQRRVNNLTLTGTMDARDFKFIRDQLPLLTELNLSGVTVVAYSGNEGTYHTAYYEEEFYAYPANEIPPLAFERYSTDIKLDFPSNVTSIGARAFYGCSKLTELTIPSSITFIGASAFEGCYYLTDMVLPPLLTSIENNLFKWCANLTSMTIPSTVTSIGNYAFSSCVKLTILEIPNSVTSIGRNAFELCDELQTVILPEALDSIKEETFYASGLTSIKLPASVKYIDTRAFRSCYKLTQLYAYPINPPDLGAYEVFAYIDKTECILYVPSGSKEKYAIAAQWEDFLNIVEIKGFELSHTELTMGARPAAQSIDITTDAAWTAKCDKEWLSFSPASGNSSQTITFTALENTTALARTATITVSVPGTAAKTIIVTQRGIATEVAEMAQNKPSVTCYPNPFTEKIAIEILNPKQEKMTVDIYNLAGQRVRNLTLGNRAEKITLSWDGKNEQGKQMPQGIYLLKVNNQTRKVMKR